MRITTLEKSLLVGFVFTILFSLTGFFGKCQNINDKIFRFHVLANSNSVEDQNLKLQVRDRVLNDSGPELSFAKNKEEAKNLTEKSLDKIKECAENEIQRRGYSYPVKVEIKKTHFNTRHYDNVVLPAGNYDSLRILIGEGEGENWWCVMFPNMCLPAAQKNEVKKQNIEDVLNKNEIELIKNEKKYEIKFKLVEWFQNLKEKFKGV